jgi:hypothetical protein
MPREPSSLHAPGVGEVPEAFVADRFRAAVTVTTVSHGGTYSFQFEGVT